MGQIGEGGPDQESRGLWEELFESRQPLAVSSKAISIVAKSTGAPLAWRQNLGLTRSLEHLTLHQTAASRQPASFTFLIAQENQENCFSDIWIRSIST